MRLVTTPVREGRRRDETRRAGLGEDGAVLVFVVGTMSILTLFMLIMLAMALNSMQPARQDQDSKIAVMAAEAGLEEYVSRLNANSNYWNLGNNDPGNPAFTTGQTIQGTNGAGASYTYSVVSNNVAQLGALQLKVTGTSSPGPGRQAVSRTLTATLKPSGFLDYVYLTDYEVQDPDLTGAPAVCASYYYAGRSGRSQCSDFEIQWVAGDTVNGPLHSNDALQVNGPAKFLSPKTESSWPAIQGMAPTAKTWWGDLAAPWPATVPTSYAPVYAPPIQLPAGNTSLATHTTPGVDGNQTGAGCYYTGPTRIIFQGSTMRVLSPSTHSDKTPNRCLNVAGSNETREQVVDIPPVIYVDGTATCTAGIVSGSTTYSISGGHSGVGFPAGGETYSAPSSTDFHSGSGREISTNYHCTRGLAFVQGSADTRVTVGARDDVVITGNLTLTGGPVEDVIGLIAGNYIWVYHPLNSSNNNLLSTPVSTIQAAILSLRHSFVVQNWASGAHLGTLHVTGSIAQKYRGPVGSTYSNGTITGYLKNYVYDQRFTYLMPPYFLLPDSSPWDVSTVIDK